LFSHIATSITTAIAIAAVAIAVAVGAAAAAAAAATPTVAGGQQKRRLQQQQPILPSITTSIVAPTVVPVEQLIFHQQVVKIFHRL